LPDYEIDDFAFVKRQQQFLGDGIVAIALFQNLQSAFAAPRDLCMTKLGWWQTDQFPFNELAVHPIVGELLERFPAQQVGRRRHL